MPKKSSLPSFYRKFLEGSTIFYRQFFEFIVTISKLYGSKSIYFCIIPIYSLTRLPTYCTVLSNSVFVFLYQPRRKSYDFLRSISLMKRDKRCCPLIVYILSKSVCLCLRCLELPKYVSFVLQKLSMILYQIPWVLSQVNT